MSQRAIHNNRLVKLAAVALSASLFLFGCSGGQTSADAGAESAAGITPADDTSAVNNSDDMTVNENIHVNQIGYRTEDMKQVIVNGKASGFAILDAGGGTPVFEGKLVKGTDDADSGDKLYYGDFTGVESEGTYFITVPGMGRSGSFTIGERPFRELKESLLKSFYFQRCGMNLEEKYASQWAHAACHTAAAKVYGDESREIDGSGGWHDAGDYGKYAVPAAAAAADLMMTFEFFPDSFGDGLNIPESGNGVPDILDEARYGLEWMLKMQDDRTGAVFHKLTAKTFPALALLPQDDNGDLFCSPVSASATADLAAVSAMASRIYGAFDRHFAAVCLEASERAWLWLENNKSSPGFRNPGEISTGEYGDGDDSDERFWAAVELYRATGNKAYKEYIALNYKNSGIEYFGFGWQGTGGFAGASYLFAENEKQDPVIYAYIENCLLNAAGSKLEKSSSSGYHVTLGTEDYYWGSNSVALNDARLLILAAMLGLSAEKQAALSNFNYILGANCLNQCYITGFGQKPVLDPHHRPSKGDNAEQPVPGMVAGGPNSSLEDDIARINLKKLPPARCYIDHSGSYSTNEVAIYWNSPAVFVAAYFDR